MLVKYLIMGMIQVFKIQFWCQSKQNWNWLLFWLAIRDIPGEDFQNRNPCLHRLIHPVTKFCRISYIVSSFVFIVSPRQSTVLSPSYHLPIITTQTQYCIGRQDCNCAYVSIHEIISYFFADFTLITKEKNRGKERSNA